MEPVGCELHALTILRLSHRFARAQSAALAQAAPDGRLVRVLGHEIDSSLTPIQSIAGSLRTALGRTREDDLARGLAVIERRAEALCRFMGGYSLLARLPSPNFAPVDVDAWVARGAALETRVPVLLQRGPSVTIAGDADQLDQLFINLLRNASEATLEAGGAGITVSWVVDPQSVELLVKDEGPGVAETASLFVPFYTTKPKGSGIGLPLSRQIAEAHGGRLEPANRHDRTGAAARLPLPRRRAAAP